MKLSLRAALHLDWTGGELQGNRYAELVSVYYTLAWFDRYVRGQADAELAADALDRLVASEFDSSADRHNISQGFYDPVAAALSGDLYAGNVPYEIAGLSTVDRMSFYFRSQCFLTTPGSSVRLVSEDLRRDRCAIEADASAGPDPQGPSGDPAPIAPESPQTSPTLPATGGGSPWGALLLVPLLVARWLRDRWSAVRLDGPRGA